MKKLSSIAVLTLLSVLVLFTAINLRHNAQPLKYAIGELPDDSRDYIIVKCVAFTDAWWMAIGDSDNPKYDYDDERLIAFTGKSLPSFVSDVEMADNLFVCYGNYLGTVENLAGAVYAFEMQDWDILAPIKRLSGSSGGDPFWEWPSEIIYDLTAPAQYLTALDFSSISIGESFNQTIYLKASIRDNVENPRRILTIAEQYAKSYRSDAYFIGAKYDYNADLRLTYAEYVFLSREDPMGSIRINANMDSGIMDKMSFLCLYDYLLIEAIDKNEHLNSTYRITSELQKIRTDEILNGTRNDGYSVWFLGKNVKILSHEQGSIW
ncbi:MAG: hypothetical protein LBP30_03735 [Clostridiales Family XIII bacterium]|nr:hypothetical protein [Clostridiales Family XIII bacterium]